MRPGRDGWRRLLAPVVAVAVGGLAAGAVWSYLGSVQDRAYGGAELVRVFVVARDIKLGLSGEQAIADGLVHEDEIPRKFRPDRALTDLDAIRGKVAGGNLPAGQILGEGFFVESRSSASSFAQRIPDGQVAISVHVDAVHGVANLVAPGDEVDILIPAGGGMRTLFQSVDVIAVGSTPPPAGGDKQGQGGGGDSGLVTFAVPPVAAERIALAASSTEGGLYLSLVPPGSRPVPVPPVDANSLVPAQLSPYA